eukprot:SAG31_NODE_18642_length_628_cov_1.071834_1_plen_63_part_00
MLVARLKIPLKFILTTSMDSTTLLNSVALSSAYTAVGIPRALRILKYLCRQLYYTAVVCRRR